MQEGQAIALSQDHICVRSAPGIISVAGTSVLYSSEERDRIGCSLHIYQWQTLGH